MNPCQKRRFGFIRNLLKVLMCDQGDFAADIPAVFGLTVLIVDPTEFRNELHNFGVIFSDILCHNLLLSRLVLQGLKRFTRSGLYFNGAR